MPNWSPFIGYGISIIALLLSLYNFKKALPKLYIQSTFLKETKSYSIIRVLVSNESSRTITITSISLTSGKNKVRIVETKYLKQTGHHVFTDDGHQIELTTKPLSLPQPIKAFEVYEFDLAVPSSASNGKCRIYVHGTKIKGSAKMPLFLPEKQ